MNLIAHICIHFKQHIERLYAVSLPSSISITLQEDGAFGDLSCNAPLVLAKILGKQPRAIAQEIVAAFTHTAVERIEIAGPGFLNIFLTPQAYQILAHELCKQGTDFFKTPVICKKYSLEFVSANPTGPLHLGHGRGGIIGDVLGNILSFLGHQVTKEFYINDAGNQIEKLGISFKARCLQQLEVDAPLPADGYQGTYLVDLAHTCVAQQGEKLLSQSDTFFAHYAMEALLQNIRQTLTSYGIVFSVWFSEKSLYKNVFNTLEELTRRGYTYEQDGALWFKSTAFGDDKDRVLKRNTGPLTYVASDAAYLKNKIDRGFDHLIMVLGQDHHSYVVRLKAMLQALGHAPDMLDVILYQLVTIKESGEQVRMSKRAGTFVTLEEVIKTVGTDVARFFYLNKKADAHLEFDLDLALKKTDENPVYYVQYAYVRTASILKKAQEVPELATVDPSWAQHVGMEEKALIKKIAHLKDLLMTISENYQTHLLTYYVLELAQTFHQYYAHHQVINQQNIETSKGRLVLVHITHNTLHTALTLLGNSTPQHM